MRLAWDSTTWASAVAHNLFRSGTRTNIGERYACRRERSRTLRLVTKQEKKASDFRTLHAGEAFVMPNPWDAGSARVLAALGFKALATTSSGFAFTLGRLDRGVTLDEMVAHAEALDAVTELPLSVDLEHGYGPDPEHAALAITRIAESGAVGASIEDYDPAGRIYERGHAKARITAAAEAARALGFPFTLTARAENHIRGNPDLEDTIARLALFEEAGADVLYAPGLRSVEEIRAVCQAVAKPVNVLARADLSLAEIVDAGARRVSVGGALTWVAARAMVEAAQAIRDHGDFSALGASLPLAEWFAAANGMAES
jgi:2-methylisocitrate lyase-like PEP mutase family enzyme